MRLLAHQGGWDEILLVLAPLSIFAVLLYVANVRAGKQLDARQHEDEHDGEPEQGEEPPR